MSRVKVMLTAAMAVAMMCVLATAGFAHGRPWGGGSGGGSGPSSPSNGAAYDQYTTAPWYQAPFGATAENMATFNWIMNPTAMVGANVPCTPTRQHPYPVVLVHGTLANEGANWVTLGPLLANMGYCVYALNYGVTWGSLGGRIDGIGDIPSSAQQLGDFINQVLAETGASQVNIVGHSQGGMMPSWYLKFDGGASKVHELIGLAPSNHGTDVQGEVEEIDAVPGLNDLLNGFADQAGYAALVQQMSNSQTMQTLFASGDTVPGVRYVVIESEHDEVVTPYTNAWLHGPDVTNILIQDQCPDDPVAHIGMFDDWPVLQNVINQLASHPAHDFQAQCTNYGQTY